MQERPAGTALRFGDPDLVDGSLSESVRGLVGSEILRIAGEIRAMVAAGRPVCNLTVGDFDTRYFPIPARLLEGIHRALDAGETNYPPSDGLASLRRAVADYTAREWDVRYPVESILIASGARPILYAAYRCVLNPGDKVVYPVPSWNNNHYAWISGAEGVKIATRAEDGFMPTPEQLAPHMADARMLCVNTPLNPAGTVMDPERLRAVTLAVLEENERRSRQGRAHLFLLHDQVYAALVYGAARHVHPLSLVPEAAPWVISLDGASKAFAATGLRVGWVLAAPALVARMRDLVGHMGAWAPRAEQVALAAFLDDRAAVQAFREEIGQGIGDRLDRLARGLKDLGDDGYPVEYVPPQGGIYMSLRLDLIGRTVDGESVHDNETIRRLLLERAGLAVVPFQAFGLDADTGWFRMSVGAVGVEDIEQAFPRLRRLLDRVG